MKITAEKGKYETEGDLYNSRVEQGEREVKNRSQANNAPFLGGKTET